MAENDRWIADVHCRFAIPPWPELMKFRVVVTTCYDASILANAQCTNTALAKLEHYVMSALHPTKEVARGVVPHWTHLLIDEVSRIILAG